jgi:hypothetical protein
MKGRGYLLWRQGPSLWAVPAQAVQAIGRGEKAEIRLGEKALPADEVLGIVQDLSFRPPGKIFATFWPFPCLGLGVFGQIPVVVLAPEAPPPLLCKGEP